MKFILGGIILSLSAVSAGSGVAISSHPKSAPVSANTISRTQADDSTVSILSKHDAEIYDIARMAQEGKDDRKIIHDKMDKLATDELEHHNEVKNRLDVDEAKLGTAITVGGTILFLAQGTLLFFHFDDRFRRNRA